MIVPKLKVYEADELYIYPVPLHDPSGYHSYVGTKPREKPFNLATDAYSISENLMGLPPLGRDYRLHQMTKRLWRIRELLKFVGRVYDLETISVFRAMQNVDCTEWALVKESYVGHSGLAVFELSKEWIVKSSVSWCGCMGKVSLVPDVQNMNTRVPIFQSSPKTVCELCIPVYDHNGCLLLGVLCCESFKRNHFTTNIVLELCKICYDFGQSNMFTLT